MHLLVYTGQVSWRLNDIFFHGSVFYTTLKLTTDRQSNRQTNKQTDRQDKKQYAPDHSIRGHKNLIKYQNQLNQFIWKLQRSKKDNSLTANHPKAILELCTFICKSLKCQQIHNNFYSSKCEMNDEMNYYDLYFYRC